KKSSSHIDIDTWVKALLPSESLTSVAAFVSSPSRLPETFPKKISRGMFLDIISSAKKGVWVRRLTRGPLKPAPDSVVGLSRVQNLFATGITCERFAESATLIDAQFGVRSHRCQPPRCEDTSQPISALKTLWTQSYGQTAHRRLGYWTRWRC
ncbi:hypothetical protein BaRGS_00002106, partial [Batillaria attramentaria]